MGDRVVVEGDAFADGHDRLSCDLLWRKVGAAAWCREPMQLLSNDRWRGQFTVSEMGAFEFTIAAWIDHFKTWQGDLKKRLDAGQDVALELETGAAMVEEALARCKDRHDKKTLREAAGRLRSAEEPRARIEAALGDALAPCLRRWPDPRLEVRFDRTLPLWVDRPRARFSAWYEIFPRSASGEPGVHGTFQDCEKRLPYVASMGFDVLYLPPIHPIGRQFRKGPDNSLESTPDDVGSPWAIGSHEGGHKSVNPQLGTLDDFDHFVAAAKAQGLEVALDIALQCSPDHPYVTEHPEWFKKRPDGSIRYAENPPKKYQDIYPFDFECANNLELREELKSIFQFWIDHGIRIFRVDNPHTKPFRFWDWLIAEVHRDFPDALFLAEAFTRPKVLYRLAKGGFSQSYTYFTWRNTKRELETYLAELTRAPQRDFLRPNFWPNTPDILNAYLQMDGRAAFMIRLVLAATLSSNYGIYGPAFELFEREPIEPGSEEYRNSEKYELRNWDWDRPDTLRHVIARINRIRNENEALQQTDQVHFHAVDNQEIICYSKTAADGSHAVLVVVSLDAHHTQSGWVELDLEQLDLDPHRPFQVQDLVSGARYLWHGARNFVQMEVDALPAHVFRVRRRVRTERDFDYYL